MTRIMDTLAARMDRVKKGDKGFTLIELLVVVIIIGILAAIAIPVYIGVQNNAKDSGVKSDLANLKTAVVSIQTQNGTAPAKFTDSWPTATATVDWAKAGATKGTDTSKISYGPTATGFCVIGESSTGNKFYATDTNGVSSTVCTIP